MGDRTDRIMIQPQEAIYAKAERTRKHGRSEEGLKEGGAEKGGDA